MSANLGNSSGQEVDLNITPVIDCFTVLITFLLASASFLSIGFFEVSTPGPSMPTQTKEPEIEVVLKLKADQSVVLSWKGKRTGTQHFKADVAQELESMTTVIQNLKKDAGEFNQVLVTAEDSVPYSSVAKVMDQIQIAETPVVMGDFQ